MGKWVLGLKSPQPPFSEPSTGNKGQGGGGAINEERGGKDPSECTPTGLSPGLGQTQKEAQAQTAGL